MAKNEEPEVQKVIVVGAGPVGALAALYAGKRGDEVHVYELRDDLRNASTTPLNFTKSINLALSERGINSMRESPCEGLLEDVLAETIPMHARMIHGRRKNGEIYEESQAYDTNGRCIQAVDRASLNKRLLDALEKMPNVTLHFNHKLTGADFKKQTAWFEEQRPKRTDHPQNPTQNLSEQSTSKRATEIAINFDLLIGADGAHSATRYHMMKYARINYTQSYIDTLWCEFRIPPSPTSTFAISPHHLHIWPAGSFMFIAIPSLDHSFTCTLFAPSSHFATLTSNPSLLPQFFNTHFPGVTPALIPTEALIDQFTSSPHLPLISIKCSPHHFSSSAVILGDAAHAMVPFYGQGMNAGLEDVRVLFSMLDTHGVYPTPKNPKNQNTNDPHTRTLARSSALSSYTHHRVPDAHTINDLALLNYLEMRSGVQSPLYKTRKWLEETIDLWFPSLGWHTQYSRISFGNERYSEVERKVRWQGRVLAVGGVVMLGVVGVVVGVGWRGWGGRWWGRWG